MSNPYHQGSILCCFDSIAFKDSSFHWHPNKASDRALGLNSAPESLTCFFRISENLEVVPHVNFSRSTGFYESSLSQVAVLSFGLLKVDQGSVIDGILISGCYSPPLARKAMEGL